MAVRGSQSLPDEALMLRYQRGDIPAFAELVHRHKTGLFNFVIRQVRHPQIAEDILQDVFLRVVQSAADFKHDARFSTWVYTIARNLCVDNLRKMALRNHDSLDQASKDQGPPLVEQTRDPSYASSVDRSALSNEVRTKLIDAIEALPEDQREVFLLREIANVPFKDIAVITQTPENTVKSRMRYALERLQSSLTDYEEDARSVR